MKDAPVDGLHWPADSGSGTREELVARGVPAPLAAASVRADGRLIPRLWRRTPRTCVEHVGLRMRLELRGEVTYARSRGDGPLLSAHGMLLEEPSPWTDRRLPLVVVEGEHTAALLASLGPDVAVVACPGAWNVDDAPPSDLRASTLARQLPFDLLPLSVAGRPVRILTDRDDASERPCPSPTLTLLVRALDARGACVLTACPPLGAPASLLAWLEDVDDDGPLVDPDHACRWLTDVLEGHSCQTPAAVDYPASAATRVDERIEASQYVGPAGLVIPAPFGLLESPEAGVGMWRGGRWLRLSGSAFWPVTVRGPRARRVVQLALPQRRGQRSIVQTLEMTPELLDHPRMLFAALADEGVWLHPRHRVHIPDYLRACLAHNAFRLPSAPLVARTW